MHFLFFVAGLTLMRLLTGSVLRKVNELNIMFISFGLIFIGLIILKTGTSLTIVMLALVLSGAGLAGGFLSCWVLLWPL
jgi:FHS family glucose/mannose:H+ symporter-like MFS transporter